MPSSAPENVLIAIIDDDESVRGALDRLMRSAGYHVATYASGADFLPSLRHCRPACVVTDLHMPRVNGFDVMAALANGPRIPVLVIRGDRSLQTAARAKALGAVACLSKPIEGDVLLDAINAALRPGKDQNKVG